MGLVKGDNTYALLSEADTYFTTRLDATIWEAATETNREKALATATMLLDEFVWVGMAADEDQLLAFPRIGSYFDPRLGYTVDLSATIPNRIYIATCELALHLLANEGLLIDSGSVTDVNVGSIRLTEIKNASIIPDIVKRQIKPLLINQGSNTWWRNN